jgi:hypothetical protein
VTWKDPDSGEEIDTGLVRVKATVQTAGGGKVDVGGGNEFGGAGEDEGVDDAEESKLDQFWAFAAIENEIKFSNFNDFKKNYWMPFLVTFQKLAVEKGLVKDEAEMKAKGKKIANNTGKWIKAHFDEIQFYTIESYFRDGSEVDAKFADQQFAASLAYVRYEGSDAYFYFIKDAFKPEVSSKFEWGIPLRRAEGAGGGSVAAACSARERCGMRADRTFWPRLRLPPCLLPRRRSKRAMPALPPAAVNGSCPRVSGRERGGGLPFT